MQFPPSLKQTTFNLSLGQGRNRHIFLRGQSHFSRFFSRREMSSPLFITFPTSISNFPPSLLQFSFFFSFFNIHPHFPFFPSLLFPIRQQKFPGQKSLGSLCPLPPPIRHCSRPKRQYQVFP